MTKLIKIYKTIYFDSYVEITHDEFKILFKTLEIDYSVIDNKWYYIK